VAWLLRIHDRALSAVTATSHASAPSRTHACLSRFTCLDLARWRAGLRTGARPRGSTPTLKTQHLRFPRCTCLGWRENEERTVSPRLGVCIVWRQATYRWRKQRRAGRRVYPPRLRLPLCHICLPCNAHGLHSLRHSAACRLVLLPHYHRYVNFLANACCRQWRTPQLVPLI